MSKKFQILLCFLSCTLFLSSLNAQQKISDDNRKLSIEERMIRLEEGQKSLEKRFDDLTLQMNNRFTDMNNQFDDINSKFNWLYIMLSSIIALNGVVVGSVVWLARQDRPIVQRHYDLINHREAELEKQVRRLSEEVELIKSQIEITS
jgi:chaperonin cofactor prefoldin